MIPILFSSTSTTFTSYGLGALSDCISCFPEEHRNGSYELTMEYPISGIHYSEIQLRSIIVAKANYIDAPQPFRIYKITKPINGKVTIYARHLSYDLSGIPVQPFTAAGIQSAMNGLKNNAMVDLSAWTFTTTRTTASAFKVDEPSSARSWFGGKEGSLLDIYGGEWHYDGYTCSLENSRGSDRGVTIRYGLNLTDLKQEENCAECYTGVLAFWKDPENGTLVQGSIQNVSGTFDYTRIFILDCSQDYEDAPISAQLDAKAAAYITNNNVGVPKVNLKLDFAMLSGLLNRVDLCDTVTVIFEKLGVEATAKCIRVKWNTLLDRYEEVELGDAKSELTEVIIRANSTASAALKQSEDTKNILESEIETAVEKVTGNLGGYVILHDSDGDGYPDELLIMDTDDITTATSVWRWNQQGLMWASSYTGQYSTLAITNDGKITADAITTGILRGIEILSTDNSKTVDIVNGQITTTGTLGEASGKTITTSNFYKVLTGTDKEVALLYLGGNTVNGNFNPWGGALRLSDKNGNGRITQWVSENGNGIIRLSNNNGNSAVQLSAEEIFGRIYLYAANQKIGIVLNANGGGNLYLYDDDNHSRASLWGNSTGGHFMLYREDGVGKCYLGSLTLSELMQDEPALACYDTSGNITSWYAGNRAYIKDTAEQGFVVHGHTAAHGICVDFTTSGQIDFYVDTVYVGYATVSSSDERTKTDIKPLSEAYKRAVSKVELKDFHFDFKGEVLSGANDLLRFGAIAQDVIKALESEGIDPTESELVSLVDDGKRYAINYIPFLVTRLAADEDRITALEQKNRELEERLEKLEALAWK